MSDFFAALQTNRKRGRYFLTQFIFIGKKLKELDYFCATLFSKAENMDKSRKKVMLIVLACLSASLFASKEALYWLSAIALIFHIVSLYIDFSIKRTRALGSEFKKISMLSQTFDQKQIDSQEVSRLKIEAGTKVNADVRQKFDNNVADASSSYRNEETEPSQKLLKMIQENAYWNAHLYNFAHKKAKTKVIVSSVIISLLAIVLIPNIKLDQDYTVIRLIFTVMSFGIVYEVIETMFKFKNSSKQMNELDHKISRLNNLDEHELLNIFSSYHFVISTTDPIPKSIYTSHKDMLNSTWQERI